MKGGEKMKIIRTTFLIFLLFLFTSSSFFAREECTTVVVSSRATVDGRPLLWKNRDVSDEDNEVVYLTGGTYDVVEVIVKHILAP